jgi:hypothetical protein
MSELQALVKKAETEFYPWVIEHLTIETPEQAKNCSDMLAIGKALFKSLEEARKAEKQPLIDQAKAVDDLYSPAKNRIQMAVGRLDDGLITYHRKAKAEADALLKLQYEEQETKRLAAEAALIETMLANRAALEESKTTGEVFEPAPLPALPETEAIIVEPVKQSIAGNMGSTRIVDTFDYEIIDDNAIPRELCSGDLKKIKAKHKYDKLPIPGVMITARSHTVSRFS